MEFYGIILLTLLGIQWLILVPFQLRQLIRLHGGRQEPFIARRHYPLTILFSISFILSTAGAGAWYPLVDADIIITSYPSPIFSSLIIFGHVLAVSSGTIKIYSAFYDHFYNVELADWTWYQILSEKPRMKDNDHWYLNHVDTFGNPKFTFTIMMIFGLVPCVVTLFSQEVGNALYMTFLIIAGIGTFINTFYIRKIDDGLWLNAEARRVAIVFLVGIGGWILMLIFITEKRWFHLLVWTLSCAVGWIVSNIMSTWVIRQYVQYYGLKKLSGPLERISLSNIWKRVVSQPMTRKKTLHTNPSNMPNDGTEDIDEKIVENVPMDDIKGLDLGDMDHDRQSGKSRRLSLDILSNTPSFQSGSSPSPNELESDSDGHIHGIDIEFEENKNDQNPFRSYKFIEIFSDSHGYRLFTRYLVQERGVENLVFLTELVVFRKWMASVVRRGEDLMRIRELSNEDTMDTSSESRVRATFETMATFPSFHQLDLPEEVEQETAANSEFETIMKKVKTIMKKFIDPRFARHGVDLTEKTRHGIMRTFRYGAKKKNKKLNDTLYHIFDRAADDMIAVLVPSFNDFKETAECQHYLKLLAAC